MGRLRFVILGYFLLWCASDAPALRRAWWHLDDFCQDFSATGVAHNLGLGRPGQFLVVATFALEDKGRHPAANIALRLAQGGLHAWAAALLAAVLYEKTRRRATLLAGLPFLLCPLATEATLWRSALSYPMSATLSLLGLRVLARRRVLGTGAIVAAMLTQPLAAFAAAGAWCLSAVFVSRDPPDPAAASRLRKEAVALAMAYGAGAAAALAVAATQDAPWRSRLDLSPDPVERLRVLAQANATFLGGSFLESWPALGRLHELFPLLALAPVTLASLRGRASARAWRATAMLGALLVIPYVPVLPVGETPLSDRLFYLAPLLHCGAWALADHAWRDTRVLRRLAAAVFATLVVGYGAITWTIAPGFDEVYRADLRRLREWEAGARASGADSLFVCARGSTLNPNPYGIDFRGGPPRLSAFLTRWSSEGVLEWQGTLPVTKDHDLRGECCDRCVQADSRSLHALRLADGPAYCGCAP